MERKIGYARISTNEQDLSLQINELKAVGCTLIFTDQSCGIKAERKGLDECLQALQQGDALIVWRLDRLGRSMSHLTTVITKLKERGIAFKSLHDGVIDTTTASGELVFNIFSALAQFERELIRERTRAGLVAAKIKGNNGGRKPLSSQDQKVRMAKKMFEDKKLKIEQICITLGISRATFYRYIALS
jgi:DNA invertase Pin-like site-specific DNA recombinase